MEGSAGDTDGDFWLEDGVSTPSTSQEGTLKKLLNILLDHADRDAAIAAAVTAVMSLQQGQTGNEYGLIETQPTDASVSSASLPLRRAASEGYNDPPASTSHEPSNLSNESTEQGKTAVRSSPGIALADFPGCKRLVDAYRKIFRIPNKTPLSVLYEYASRLNLTLVFEEMQEGAGPGPFVVQTTLRDADGESLYRPGIGTARAKKDAKQLAAAALLELLLETVPFQDLLYKSEKQQQLKDLQVSRMRWPSTGRGRGPPGRAAARQGGLPPFFGSPGGAPSVLPGPVHDGMPAAPGVTGRFLPGPALIPGGTAMFSAPGSAHGGRLVGGMQGQGVSYQQPGSLGGASLVGGAGQSLGYLGGSAAQGGDPYNVATGFGLRRDMRMGDVCAGFEAGANVNTVSGVRGSVSMLEASMAAMSFNASQQQQQQQQQQFIDACSASMLEQGFGQQNLEYSEGMYLDPQMPGSESTLENLLQHWPNRGPGQF